MNRHCYAVLSISLFALLLALVDDSSAGVPSLVRRRHTEAICHRDCQVSAQNCCEQVGGGSACEVTCGRNRFLCVQRCGPPIDACYRTCFLSMFGCLEACLERGLSRDACKRQCSYYLSFACSLDCRRRKP